LGGGRTPDGSDKDRHCNARCFGRANRGRTLALSESLLLRAPRADPPLRAGYRRGTAGGTRCLAGDRPGTFGRTEKGPARAMLMGKAKASKPDGGATSFPGGLLGACERGVCSLHRAAVLGRAMIMGGILLWRRLESVPFRRFGGLGLKSLVPVTKKRDINRP